MTRVHVPRKRQGSKIVSYTYTRSPRKDSKKRKIIKTPVGYRKIDPVNKTYYGVPTLKEVRRIRSK